MVGDLSFKLATHDAGTNSSQYDGKFLIQLAI